jgi:hypothetical protein
MKKPCSFRFPRPFLSPALPDVPHPKLFKPFKARAAEPNFRHKWPVAVGKWGNREYVESEEKYRRHEISELVQRLAEW